MKKTILKIAVFASVFILTTLVASKIMNKDHDNMTMEMSDPTLPVITMRSGDYSYNRLWGYTAVMDSALMWDNISVLGQNREVSFDIDSYGRSISNIGIEVRSVDGSRLIEKRDVTDISVSGTNIKANIVLKDLIEKDVEYSLAILLNLDGEEEVYYYTKIVWDDNTHLEDKLDFIKDFHDRTFDKEAAKEITKYLETNSKLEQNKSFNNVNIHSSFNQVTWGDLNVVELADPVISLTAIASQTASAVLDYQVATMDNKNVVTYAVKEYYRVKYTSDRMYLLDFERTMTQLPNVAKLCANDKIMLGIASENVNMLESEDGNVLVFEQAGKLLSFNATSNKLSVLFSFYDDDSKDERAYNSMHNIKILDVDEAGNVWFTVYGYMNRGRHEGRVGVLVYFYDSTLNTIEEEIYIDYDKGNSVLAAEMDKLMYMNNNKRAYIYLSEKIYCVDLIEKNYTKVVDVDGDDSLKVSREGNIIAWQIENDERELYVKNLETEAENLIEADSDEIIIPLGFMDDDVVYGIAKKQDIVKEVSGAVFSPMYEICICDTKGKLLKEYMQEGIFVTDCAINDNQITLSRVQKLENGDYAKITDDHILNNSEPEVGKNTVVCADIDIFERYVQIKTKTQIDTKSLKVLTPKEVVYEGGRELVLYDDGDEDRYYVFGPYGVSGIFSSPANAIIHAYDMAANVINQNGECIWIKANRVSRNQIMAITEPEKTGQEESMAYCLNTILEYEGIVRDTFYLLEQGESAFEILEDALPDSQILDLTGCPLDAILYFTNKDIPVLVTLNDGEAVLVTGFNEFNVVIMEPSTGKLYKKGMNDTTQWFSENGNRFITYTK